MVEEPGGGSINRGVCFSGLNDSNVGAMHRSHCCHLHQSALLWRGPFPSYGQLRFGQDTVFEILICAAFQFTYTYVFGAYSAFIFIRTGHLMGPVLCHSFCNQMGFPAIGSVLQHPQRPVILLSYQLGVLLFLILLFPFTDPAFYGMTPICSLLLIPRSACA